MPTAPLGTHLALRNILFPTDFSASSRAALPFAMTLARSYNSTLLITHSIPPEPHLEVVTDRLPAQDGRIRQDATRKLVDFTRGRFFGDTPVKTLLDQGDLQEVIPAIIQENSVDLIVLGTHGRRGMNKLMLGSDAEKIYRSDSCPVLTVGPHVQPVSGWKLRRILCPVDGAEDPESVLRYAQALAEDNAAEWIVLQAIPLVPWQYRVSVEERSLRALQSLIPAQAREEFAPQCLIRWEHPVEAILRASVERDSDLIVMSVHKSRAPAFAAHLPWPVASEVVSRASCPVLTLRV